MFKIMAWHLYLVLSSGAPELETSTMNLNLLMIISGRQLIVCVIKADLCRCIFLNHGLTTSIKKKLVKLPATGFLPSEPEASMLSYNNSNKKN
jgi:hypothetical protein